jgi:hypothetical protein
MKYRGSDKRHKLKDKNILEMTVSSRPLMMTHGQTYATATKKLFSPAAFFTFALSTRSSPTASLNLSLVAGLSMFHILLTFSPSPDPVSISIPFPFICLALLTASLNAKNTVLPKNSGGSPIPLLLCTDLK